MSTVGKPIRCKAAVQWAPNQKMSIEEIEVATPKSGEVRIKIVATGVCHSDVHFQEGLDPAYTFPSILGHEGVGIVESIGPNVTTVAPGDHVVMFFTPQCRNCKLCKDPRTNHCELMGSSTRGLQLDESSRITCKGKPISQMGSISTFSEYTVTSELSVGKINPKASLEKVPLVGCCVPTGYGAAVKDAKVKAGSTCAIVGLGGVGMCIAMGCRANGAKRIIGVDINNDKCQLGKKFGITEFVNPKDHSKPINEVLAEMTDGGVDYCFISVGNLDLMNIGVKIAHPSYGLAVMVGITNKGDRLTIDPWDLILGRKMMGTFYGGYKPRDEIPPLVDLYVKGKLPVDELITHTLPLEKINEAVDLMLAGKSLRSIIVFK